MPELQPSSPDAEQARERWTQEASIKPPPRHQRPKAPTNQASRTANTSISALREMAEDLGSGMRLFWLGRTTAMVKMPKLWKTCLGVRRAMEARDEKRRAEAPLSK